MMKNKLRNAYSQALGVGARYSENVGDARRITYRNVGISEAEARARITAAGLPVKRVTVTRCDVYIAAEYLRIFI